MEKDFMKYSSEQFKNTVREELENYATIISEASKRCDLQTCAAACRMLSEAVDEAKSENELRKEIFTTNFGVLNHVFEEALPSLFKSKKGVIKEAVNMIREDKNLMSEYSFYNSVKKIPSSGVKNDEEARKTLDAVVEIASRGIDRASVKESNKKFAKFLFENEIIPKTKMNEGLMKMYEASDRILTSKETAMNAVNEVAWKNAIMEHLSLENISKENEDVDVLGAITELEKKMGDTLNESEMSFVKEITDFKSPYAEERKRKLFNTIKEDCLKRLDKMISEDPSNASLIETRKKVMSKLFSGESIVKDIANLMEIRDILDEN